MQFINEVFKRMNTHTHLHKHMHAHTDAHSHEHNRRECNALHFNWKSGYWLTPLDISLWKVVHLESRGHHLTSLRLVSYVHCVYAMAKPIGLKTIMLLPMFLIKYLTLKIKVKGMDNLEKIWHANIPCEHAYVCKNVLILVYPFVTST